MTFETAAYVNFLQLVIRNIQSELYTFQGTLCRFIVDDKGTGILAAFGLPPYAQHENDAVRGAKVAMNIRRTMESEQFGLGCSVGVTSGRVYAGVVGGHTRCEYTLHGSVVNLAARLMVAAGKGQQDGVLLNEPAYNAANNEIEFDEPRLIKCKGYDYPIPVYRPRTVRESPLQDSDALNDINLICPPAQLATMKAALVAATLDTEAGGIIYVEGEPGMGKSRYCRFLAKTGMDSGFNVIRCAS